MINYTLLNLKKTLNNSDLKDDYQGNFVNAVRLQILLTNLKCLFIFNFLSY